MNKTKNKPSIFLPSKELTLKRNFNLDILRIFAFIFVPGVHFFLRSGYYSHNIDNPQMVVMTFMRTLFLLCIPLFLMITGYLQGDKKIESGKKYFSKISKVLVPYALIVIIYIIFINNILGPDYIRALYGKETLGIRQYVEYFTSFNNYSWYVNMYIGLFLLIPFLNLIWQNLNTKKQEHLLLGSLIFMTMLPSVINSFAFDAPSGNWFSATGGNNWMLFPNWWTNLYPITYYFTGAYMSRHRSESKLRPFKAFVLFLLAFGALGTFVVCRCWQGKGEFYNWTGYSSIGIYLMAITFFAFVNSFNFKRAPLFIRRVTGKLSDLTFGAYLCSWMLDQYVYNELLIPATPVFADRFAYFIPVWLFIISVSFAISAFVDLIYKAGSILITDTASKFGKRK